MKGMKSWLAKHGSMQHRSIHGVKTGEHNNPHVLRAANRASGGRCVDMVDGGMAKPRLDRPGRKMGGKVPNMHMSNAMKHLDGNPGKAASSSDASRVKSGMPKRDGSDKFADGGKVADENSSIATSKTPKWDKFDAGLKAVGAASAAVKGAGKIGKALGRAGGGKIPIETNRSTNEGGWVKGDATKHADGKDFKKGGKICRADGGPVSEYLRGRSRTKMGEAAQSGIRALGEGALAAIPEFGRPARALLGGASAMGVGDTMSKFADSRDMKRAADKWDKTGLPGKPSKEDEGRAKGGKVNWIAGATKNKGALHRALKVPEGEKIPEKKLEKAEHSSNPTMRKRAQLAETLKGMHKK